MDSELEKLLELDINKSRRRLERTLSFLSKKGVSKRLVDNGLRHAHTLKALAAVKGQTHLEHFAAQLEQLFVIASKISPEEIRDFIVPQIQTLQDELKATTDMVDENQKKRRPLQSRSLNLMIEKLHKLDKKKSQLAIRGHRKKLGHNSVQINQLFQSYSLWLQQAAEAAQKNVDLQIHVPKPLAVDRATASSLQTMLVHLLRNAVYHGVESPNIRQALGKVQRATVQLSAEIKNDELLVAVSDDGKGLPLEPPTKMDNDIGLRLMDEKEGSNTTAVETSIYATSNAHTGLGIGLHIVQEQIERLGGTFELKSIPGVGTSALMHIPKETLQFEHE